MKIGIMTWYNYINYGTALQVTALSEVLRQNGHEAEVIDYQPRGMVHSIPDNSFNAKLKREVTLRKKRHPLGRHSTSIGKEKIFLDFLDKHISLSERSDTLADLLMLNAQYDAFVCGSDQIWSPCNYDPHYFLDFVEDTEKMVAYAPSIGLPKIEDPYIKNEISANIQRFKHLSVREEQGAKLVKELTGREAKTVCDPTMLLSGKDWRKLCNAQCKSSEKYALVYMLGNNEAHWNIIAKIAATNNLNIKIVPVFEKDHDRVGCIDETVGPAEFVSLIDNAELVLTDSFHGMVFSLLLHKQFIPFERFDKHDALNQNSRVFNLLDKVGLTDRIVSHSGKYKLKQEIDFSKVDEAVCVMRNDSMGYLTESLNAVEKRSRGEARHVRLNHELCCGCGACAVECPMSAIKIELGTDGFIKATVDEKKCVKCGKCLNYCPFESRINDIKISNSRTFAYKSYDENVLLGSSSGGFAYDVSRMLLNSGYVVAGCTYDRQTKKAKHILIHTEEELHLLQGSKYMQSDFYPVLDEIKENNKKIAIIGTPCQISGAKKVLGYKDNVVYIDLICHGVPSYNLYIKYLSYLNVEYDMDINNLFTFFRYKPKGWREIHIYNTDTKRDICLNQNEDLYFSMFVNCDCFMETCYECRWRSSSEADIRIGDYWGPRYVEDNTGVSMILAMNERGNEVVQNLKSIGYGQVLETETEDYKKYQQNHNSPRPAYYGNLKDSLIEPDMPLDKIFDIYNYKKTPEIFDLPHLPNRVVKKVLGEKIYDKIKQKIKKH